MKKIIKRLLPPFLLDPTVRGVRKLHHFFLKSKSANKKKVVDAVNGGAAEYFLYYGNLGRDEKQFSTANFIGLALYPSNEKEIYHDAYEKLPFNDGTVGRVQAQDVFEHLVFENLPKILDDIYRVLKSGGIFRLSVPDYRSPLLKKRSVYDADGRIFADLMMGGSVSYDSDSAGVATSFTKDGNAHIWFPTFQKIQELIGQSTIRNSRQINFHHYFSDADHFVCNPFPEMDMPVYRAPPFDLRSDGKPISIIVDFVK